MSAVSETIDPRSFAWLAPLSDAEVAAIAFSPAGEMLDDGDWYLDATSPKRGPVLALEGEFVPRLGLYIRRSRNGEELWARLQLAAAGKL